MTAFLTAAWPRGACRVLGAQAPPRRSRWVPSGQRHWLAQTRRWKARWCSSAADTQDTAQLSSLDEAKDSLRTKLKTGAVRSATRIVEALQVPADEELYRIAIRGLLKHNRGDLAIEVYEHRMNVASPLQFELPLAANVLKQCCRLQKHDVAAKVFQEIEQRTLEFEQTAETDPSRWKITAAPFLGISSAFLAANDHARCTQTLRLLVRASQTSNLIPAEVGIYNDSIRHFGKAKALGAVFQVLDAMRASKVEHNNETFEFLAQAAVKQIDFVTGAVSMDTLPEALSEAAFVGRSNVGKSSLVNMICGRRAIAHTSKRPGKTQQFNYFLVNGRDAERKFYLVDMPGVGYAKVPKVLQEQWIEFMRHYFSSRSSLRVVFHLVDGRHGVLDDDEHLMRMISSSPFMRSGTYVVVLTKMDKLDKQRAKQRVLDSVRTALMRNGCPNNLPIILTSAETRLGRDDIWRHLRSAMNLS